jgi:hypothetical protein
MSTVPEEATQDFASTPDSQLGHLLEQHILCDVGHQSPQGALLREAIRRFKSDRLARIVEQVESSDGRWDDSLEGIRRLALDGQH